MKTKKIHTKRFYSFEDRLRMKSPDLRMFENRPMGELRKLVDRVWAVERPGYESPVIRAGRGDPHPDGGFCSYYQSTSDGEVIVLARHQRNVRVLLHELAHAMESRGHSHGPAFVRRCLYLFIRYGRAPAPIVLTEALEANLI